MSGPGRSRGDCGALLLQVSQYLDGDLTPARLRKVERHIKECVCCGRVAANLQRTLAACRAEGKARPPRAVMSRAAARIKQLVAQERLRRVKRPETGTLSPRPTRAR